MTDRLLYYKVQIFIKKNTRLMKIFIAVILLSLTGSGLPYQQKFHVEEDKKYNSIFTRKNGWTGGDIASTIPFTDSLTFWLFGDSWIGPVKKNKHTNSSMISNVVAIQNGKNASSPVMKYYYAQKDKKPESLFSPADGRGYYWLTGGGIKVKEKLYLIAAQIVKKENDNSVFAFESVGNTLLSIENPMDEPVKWKVGYTKIPFFNNSDDSEVDFGIPQFIKGGLIYIYGVELRKKEKERYMLLARVAEDKILNFEDWEFYSEGKWEKDFRKADRLCNHFGAEYSVCYHPFLKKFITIYTELGMSDKIMMRSSVNPEGPWSDQIEIYRTPETKWSKNYFCYAARAHIELSGKNDLLVSYVCNSFDFWEMAADARIYRPKFIRVIFDTPEN
jgi:hypothetical protein